MFKSPHLVSLLHRQKVPRRVVQTERVRRPLPLAAVLPGVDARLHQDGEAVLGPARPVRGLPSNQVVKTATRSDGSPSAGAASQVPQISVVQVCPEDVGAHVVPYAVYVPERAAVAHGAGLILEDVLAVSGEENK